MKAPLLAVLLPLLGLQDGVDVAASFAAGEQAYAAGRFPEALAAFAKAEQAAGEAAPAELYFDLALSALRAGRAEQAAEAATKALARGADAAACDFLVGNAAFARCERADAAASLMDPEPGAFDTAIALAQVAAQAWQRAVVARGEWPEAVRNVERAQHKRKDLERRKLEAERNRLARPKLPSEPRPLPLPLPEPVTGPEEPQPAQPTPQLAPLPASEVQRLMERLLEKEQLKLALRRREQEARRVSTERDW